MLRSRVDHTVWSRVTSFWSNQLMLRSRVDHTVWSRVSRSGAISSRCGSGHIIRRRCPKHRVGLGAAGCRSISWRGDGFHANVRPRLPLGQLS